MGWFRKDKNEGESTPKAPETPPPDASPEPAQLDPVEAEHHEAMDRYWNSIGSVDSDVLTYLMNPMFMGGPPWPNTRQAYRLVRTDDTLIISSDGLADPFPEDPNAASRFGFGMETFIEVKGMQDATTDDVRQSWAFRAIENMAMNTAKAGGFVQHLQQHGSASIELPIDNGPDGWLNSSGIVGALIDLEMTGRSNMVEDTPISPVRIVPITLVYPSEIDLCATGGQARLALSADLAEQGYGHVTDISRPNLR